MSCLCKLKCQIYKIFYAESFRAKFEYRVCNELCELLFAPSFAVCLGADERLDGVAECLAALVESGLHDCLEKGLIASELLA
jgi:hypothetical protein